MEIKTLFVANLPSELTEEALYGQFVPYGVQHVRIIGEKGIAFIELPADRMQEAIDEKHDSELAGRRLRVNEARPRDEGGGNRG